MKHNTASFPLPLKHRKHASLLTQLDRPIFPTSIPSSSPTTPFPFWAKLSTNWFFSPLPFLFPPSPPPPALDSNASGLWEIFIHIDRWQSWWVFHERQSSNCFCPTNVSKYQLPVGGNTVGLQIRAMRLAKDPPHIKNNHIKDKHQNNFTIADKRKENIHQTQALVVMESLCWLDGQSMF